MITLMGDENLRLVLQTPESGRMDNPVAVALEATPRPALGFTVQPATAFRRKTGVRRTLAISKADAFFPTADHVSYTHNTKCCISRPLTNSLKLHTYWIVGNTSNRQSETWVWMQNRL